MRVIAKIRNSLCTLQRAAESIDAAVTIFTMSQGANFFVGTFGYVNFSMRWGPIVNLLLFFMTGLPGGLDYALLAAVKQGWLPPLREKAINAKINTYVRAPGLVFTAALLYTCARTSRSRVHPFAAGLCAALCYGNGVFYGWQVNDDFSGRVAAVAAAGGAAAAT